MFEGADHLEQYTSLTRDEAKVYCAGSENQRVRDVIAERVNAQHWTVLDYGCGPGLDARRYDPGYYMGADVSRENIAVARANHPDHTFVTTRLPGVALPRHDVVMIKSVLEHTPTVGHALELLFDAVRLARHGVFVAWHTPPWNGPETINQVRGHAGKLIWQNSYDLHDFRHFHRTVEQVDNFTLWWIATA